MIPAVILAVIAFVAGKPAQVACDADVNPPIGVPPGFVVEAWTKVGGDTEHVVPRLCAGFSARPGSIEFARSIRVVIHESAHARGVWTEDCAELYADLVVFDVLRQFYNIPFFSPLSEEIGAQVLAETRLRPSYYQPTERSCSA